MCAIMGILNKDKNVNESILEGMQKALHHRGPNDTGLHICKFGSVLDNFGVAFNRLSIRDLSMAGHQPMLSPNKDVMIAFNGEIYNSEELRPELINDGVEFNGHSDTEVILHLYLKYGVDNMLNLLDGMFAICILDKRIDKIFLIRDRIGEKPLYIYRADSLLMFASEYKAFYANPDFTPSLNEDAVDEYFLFRYTSHTDTFLKGVCNLEPGSYWIVDNKFNIDKKNYWNIPGNVKKSNSDLQNKKVFEELLEKSVSRRLISDVPVGIQLSGGVDSSYLAYVVNKYVRKPLHTYCIVFNNTQYTEEKYIDFVSNKFDFILHKYDFKPEDLIEWWKKSTWFFEAPMNHEGTLALGLLNSEAKKDVTVMLCGDGPDETMGGYDRMSLMSSILSDRKSIAKWKFHLSNIKRKLHHLSPIPDLLDYSDFYIAQSQWIETDTFLNLRPSSGIQAINRVYKKRRTLLNGEEGSGLRKFMNYEMHSYMQDILMRTDKIAMASSIEMRVPYLMPELLEFICSIPDDQLVSKAKTSARGTKVLLKKLSADIYGEDFTYRSKMGLSFPFLMFFTDSEVEELINEIIMPGIEKRGVVNAKYVKELWSKRYFWKERNMDPWRKLHALWTCFSFEIWAQMYIDRNPLEQSYDAIYKIS